MLDQLDQVQVPAPLHTHPPVPVSSYAIGPIDLSHLIAMHAHCSNGEQCPLLVPKSLPLWIMNHPEFRDGYEQNYFTEEGEDDKEWRGAIPHMVNLIYSKLCGEGFEDLASKKVDPDFGVWEIGYLLRDFTRLADTDQTLALTGIAHLCFLISFLPPKQPECWPPASLVRARWPHNDAVKAYRERMRGYREQGQSFEQAQRLALVSCSSPCSDPLPDAYPLLPADSLAALLAHPDFQEGLRCGQENFFDSYEEAPLTEEEMIDEVEMNLSRNIVESGKQYCQMHGWEPDSYLYNLGFVLGTINQGLAYAR